MVRTAPRLGASFCIWCTFDGHVHAIASASHVSGCDISWCTTGRETYSPRSEIGYIGQLTGLAEMVEAASAERC